MNDNTKVSIWLGNFPSEDKLDNFMEENYDGEGDMKSKFSDLFKIDFIDNQFSEIFYYENLITKNEIFDGFSYIESFIDAIPDLEWTNYNSVVLLYNFEYDEEIIDNDSFEFLGSFQYLEE